MRALVVEDETKIAAEIAAIAFAGRLRRRDRRRRRGGVAARRDGRLRRHHPRPRLAAARRPVGREEPARRRRDDADPDPDRARRLDGARGRHRRRRRRLSAQAVPAGGTARPPRRDHPPLAPAIRRRCSRPASLRVDTRRMVTTVNGAPIALSSLEFRALRYLVHNKGRPGFARRTRRARLRRRTGAGLERSGSARRAVAKEDRRGDHRNAAGLWLSRPRLKRFARMPRRARRVRSRCACACSPSRRCRSPRR